MKRSVSFAAVAAMVVSCLAFAGAGLSYPADWRSWQHVKSMVIPDKAHGLYGFHHVYVHPKALAAYQKGKGYAEGATLVVPFYEVVDGGGAVSQGALLKVAVMKRDKTATDTGGWRYGAFDPAGKPLELDAKAGCHTCHEAKKDREFVFSEWTP
ncbi:MAG: cytochrome P460 family protein [Myxococcaceae bacterium]